MELNVGDSDGALLPECRRGTVHACGRSLQPCRPWPSRARLTLSGDVVHEGLKADVVAQALAVRHQ
jgi:hypothetical protein